MQIRELGFLAQGRPANDASSLIQRSNEEGL